ncbi:MAG TPA: prephenate dehydrogenase [Verrucomicrobiae bacterium]|nr:prephenate dehydrogenase [Verrucomicrobiae bacterium]
MHWKKVTIVGVGLLGGSLGQALRQRRLAERVVGCVRRRASIAECRRVGAVDEATTDFAAGVAGADLVVLCTPIAQMPFVLEPLIPHLRPGAIITDVGSVKGEVVRQLEPIAARARAHFVGSHPMAGSEKMGVSAARPDLYSGAVCVVTPTPKSNRRAVRAVTELWAGLDARVLKLAPAVHDQLVARSSHLPHLLACQLVNYTLGHSAAAQPLLCATGFRDTTRIASGSPEMWRDIAVTNRTNLARSLREFMTELRRLQRAVQAGDEKALADFFDLAKQRRDAWCNRAGHTSPE